MSISLFYYRDEEKSTRCRSTAKKIFDDPENYGDFIEIRFFIKYNNYGIEVQT
jgi:hypothetical protein